MVHGIGTKKDTGPWFKNILHRNMRLDGNYTKARRVPCKSCGKEHEKWDHFWKCKKYRPIWRKLCKLMNDTTEGETEEKTHRHYSRKWIYFLYSASAVSLRVITVIRKKAIYHNIIIII